MSDDFSDAVTVVMPAPTGAGDLAEAKIRVVHLAGQVRDQAAVLEQLAYSRLLPETAKRAIYHAAFDAQQAFRMLADAREELERAARALHIERRGGA